MFVIYNGTTPLFVIQIEGDQIRVGVPVATASGEVQPPAEAWPDDIAEHETPATPRWKIPVPSLN